MMDNTIIPSQKIESTTRSHLFLKIAIAWSIIVIGSISWNMINEKKQVMDEAYAAARAVLNKDISFRRWASGHGGVYVPVTETQQPVPWLAHLPNRDIETIDGRHLTLLNPASMLRQMMDRYAADYGVQGRIIGLKQLNPNNSPDEWEQKQLKEFKRGSKAEVWDLVDINGEPNLRYLRVMMMEPGCDKCHGILGYKTGDVRGATGVNLPLDEYYNKARIIYVSLWVTHGVIGVAGLILIGFSWRTSRREEFSLLKSLVKEREAAVLKKEKIEQEKLNSQLESALNELKQTQVQLLQAQKMEAIGQLSAGIAHEINTPVQFVSDNLQFIDESHKSILCLLKMYGSLNHIEDDRTDEGLQRLKHSVEEYINEIDLDYLSEEMPVAIEQTINGIERISKIVKAMKVFSHPGSEGVIDFNINDIINNVVIVSEYEWKYCSTLELELQQDLPLVSGFPEKISQVLLNIIVNAAHAISGIGSVSLIKNGHIKISTAFEDNQVVIVINDNGPGVPHDVADKIFNPFFTTKEVGKGTGQGLAIAYNIINDQHKGSISVDSSLDKGTSFIIKLPTIKL